MFKKIDDEEKKRQIRKTHQDTKTAQNKMRNIIKNKIYNDTTLIPEEYNEWVDLVADSLLSVGVDKKVYYDKPEVRICFGSVHTFALRFIDWKNPVHFVYNKKEYVFQIKTLWMLLYENCLELFPYALADAIHMSKESEEHERWEGYEFSSKESLDHPT
jgi:hypothetical protein